MQNETKQPESTNAGSQAWLRALMLRDPGRWSSRLGALMSWLKTIGRGRRRRLGRAAAGVLAGASGVALMAMLAGPMAPPVHAATITVDGTTCTLIDAIKAANTDTAQGGCVAGAGDDTIVLGGDLAYTVSYASFSGPTALPSVTSKMTISGDLGGGTRATLSRGDRAFWLDNLSPKFRLLHVAGTGDLTLKNLNLIYGNPGDWDGGAIFVDDNGKLTLEETTFDSNGVLREGGAIFADRDSSVTMTDSEFRSNYSGRPGAGIYSYGTISGTNVIFDSNFANDDAGAIYIAKRAGDVSLTLTYAYFTNNEAGDGKAGAIYANEATVSLIFAEFSGNSAAGAGGAIYVEDVGSLSISYSAFYENSSGYNGGGAIYSHYGTHTTITNTTFISNTTEDYGGAIFIDTVDGSDVGSVKLTHVTITGNSAGNGGGGIYVREGTTHTVTRSIISGNSSPIGAEIYAQGDNSLTSSFNVLGSSATNNTQAFEDFTPSGTDKTATSDGTNPTALSGILDSTQAGEGFYRYLVDGSPAIDIASGATCDVPYDQIGNSRPQGAGCDAGAIEYYSYDDGYGEPGVFISTWTFGSVDQGPTREKLNYTQLDILAWDGESWTKWFDGIDAGLNPDAYKPGSRWKHNINAMSISDVEAGDVYMSFTQNDEPVPGIPGRVDGMDVVFWDGEAEEWEMIFKGKLRNIGLNNKTQEKIDGLHVMDEAPEWSEFAGQTCEAYMLISTQGPGLVPKPGNIKPKNVLKFNGEDVLGFCATNLGANTTGFWEMVLDGSEYGVKRNNIESISMGEDGATLYLTSKAQFNVDDAFGGHSMVYTFDMDTETFDGPVFTIFDAGMEQKAKLDALHVTGDPSEWLDLK